MKAVLLGPLRCNYDNSLKLRFSAGRVRWVQLDIGEDAEDADHCITPEESLRIAMTIQ